MRRTTGAPATRFWHAGETVEHHAIPPHTAAATFDADGRYGNHTDGSSHAVIIMESTPKGFWALEQYNVRNVNNQIIHRVSLICTFTPSEMLAGQQLQTAVTIMSYANATAWLVLCVCQASSARAGPPVSCPQYLSDHRLDSVEIFDGLPSSLIDLQPTPGGWDLSGKPPPPEGVHLVCSYHGTSATKDIRLPDDVRGCWFDNHWPHVICR